MYFAGIDAGGTKTDFLLCDETEKEIKRVTLGAGNPNDIGIDACLALLSEGLDELCGGIMPNAVFAGVSGGGYGEYAERIGKFLKERFPNSCVDNGTDAINLLYCSESSDNVGALICGTGNAFFVRKGNEIHRFCGWGHLFEDGGSAYALGRDALRLMLEYEEKVTDDRNSSLFYLLRQELGSSAHEALSLIYQKGKPYIASLAPLVFKAYSLNDNAASMIIDANIEAVCMRVAFAFEEIGAPDEIVCAGGLLNSYLFYELLSKNIPVPLKRLTVPPVYGACRRAMSLIEGDS